MVNVGMEFVVVDAGAAPAGEHLGAAANSGRTQIQTHTHTHRARGITRASKYCEHPGPNISVLPLKLQNVTQRVSACDTTIEHCASTCAHKCSCVLLVLV